MKRYPFVSVIIPVCNASIFIDELMEALKSQTYPAEQRECIIIDNGSTDDTVARIRESIAGGTGTIAGGTGTIAGGTGTIAGSEESADPQKKSGTPVEESVAGSEDSAARLEDPVSGPEKSGVFLLHETSRQNPYIARNRGLRSARGEMIALLDANKIPDPDWLEEGVRALLKEEGERAGDPHSPAPLAGGEILFDLSDQPETGELLDAMMFNNNRQMVLDLGCSAGGNLFFPRQVWESNGSFPEEYRSGMDIRWTRNAVNRGHRLVFAEKAIVRCKPRKFSEIMKKAYRVGTAHPYNMKNDGIRVSRIIASTLSIFLWPRRDEVQRGKETLSRYSHLPAANPWKIRAGMWLLRIAMGAGRLKSLPVILKQTSK